MGLQSLILTAGVIIFPSIGLSQSWQANVDGPDVFGKTSVMALAASGRTNLILQCDSGGLALFAMTEKSSDLPDDPVSGILLLIKTENSDLIKADAIYQKWNSDYVGTVVTDPEVVSAISESLKLAAGSIQVGIDAFGNQVSASFSSSGSTAAMTKVQEHCKFGITPDS